MLCNDSFPQVNLATLKGRLQSFQDWPVMLMKKEELAEHGFYHDPEPGHPHAVNIVLNATNEDLKNHESFKNNGQESKYENHYQTHN